MELDAAMEGDYLKSVQSSLRFPALAAGFLFSTA